MTDETKIILERLGSMAEDTKMALERLDRLDSRMDAMESKMDAMESKMNSMESNMDDMKSQISGINMILENEIRRNIQIVAEGHLDLSRKLDDAIKVKEEREMLLVRTNVLESEVKMIKGKVDALCSAG